jgi:hypothetical protein
MVADSSQRVSSAVAGVPEIGLPNLEVRRLVRDRVMPVCLCEAFF